MSSNSPSEPKRDYLEVDDPIPGQNFVCMSFVSPEEVIADRNLFMVHSFLKTNAKEFGMSQEDIVDKYKDFVFVNEGNLTKEYDERNDFRTSVRGLKVRGTYDTEHEAKRRAKILQKTDPSHNVFVGQVGYWLPWDPSPSKIKKQEYANKELNELMEKYEENQEARKVEFNKRVEREMEEANKKTALLKEKNRKVAEESTQEDTQSENVLEQVMESTDAWTQNKEDEFKNNAPVKNKDKDE